MFRTFRSGLLCAALFLFALPVSAQWVKQSIVLNPGWNAVYLEVAPENDNGDTLFANLPVESVWMWNGKFQAAQFMVDPESLLPQNPDWLVYFPPGSPQAAAKTLYVLEGGKPYLIKFGGTSPATWNVTGLPITRPPEWISDSFNLVGFGIDGSHPATLGGFFADSQAQAGQQFFQLNSVGKWVKADPSTFMAPGRSYWVYSQGGCDFAGPVTTGLRTGGTLDFGRNASQLQLDIQNNSTKAKTIRLVPLSSDAPPSSSDPVIAGDVPLSYFDDNPQAPGSVGEWKELAASSPMTFTLAAGQPRTVLLAVRRQDMKPPPSGVDFLYESLLEATDGEGTRIVVPVSSQGMEGVTVSQTTSTGAQLQRLVSVDQSTTAPVTPYAGLWVGTVIVNEVSEPTYVPNRLRLAPASGEFRFRLILHVDNTGKVRLLQQVTVMAKTVNGQRHMVLVTDDSLLSQFEGIFERDGALVGQRISSAVFPFFHIKDEPTFTLPQLPGGTFEDGSAATTNTIQFDVVLPYNDPLNPFVHQYNPDHDNLDPNFKPWDPSIIDGKESWTVDRLITMNFSPVDPTSIPGSSPPDWLVSRVGGTYREEVRGLYRTDWNRLNNQGKPIATPIIVAGRFQLTQVSSVGVLNDGQN